MRKTAALASLGMVVLVAIGVIWWASGRESERFGPPERQGPPALISRGDRKLFWIVLRREETGRVTIGGSRHSLSRGSPKNLVHFELHEFDPLTARPVRQWPLLKLDRKEGSTTAQARMLGQDNDAVWFFLHDQPVALSVFDASRRTDRAGLSTVNPDLRGLLSRNLSDYAFNGKLLLTTADARTFVVPSTDFRARPYDPGIDGTFDYLRYMTATWHGAYETKDFTVRHAFRDGEWVGLFTNAEAGDAAADEFGDHYKSSDNVLDEGPRARRRFWKAEIGRTREFTEGSHPRLTALQPLPDLPDYLYAGLLIRQGTREPLRLSDPEGVLLLYRTRLDEQGRLMLARLDSTFRPLWTTELPLREIGNRWELGERLLFYGSTPSLEQGISRWNEYLVTVDMQSGRTLAWDINGERPY